VVISTWMIAHNVVYTYIAPYLRDGGAELSVDLALVTFGVAALVGLGLTGAVIDRALRLLVFASIALFITAGLIFVVGHESRAAVLVAIILWGIAYGGAATQLQTAVAEASGPNVDVANSMLGVAFNLAIFAAGVVGAVLISTFDGLALPVVMIALALVALVIALAARASAFPSKR
jgi:predicted MFS family arabinose efflux permease